MYVADNGAPVFTGCSFVDNEADVNGPATHKDGTATANPESDFYISYGGAVAFEDGSAPEFIDCTFNGNLATIGGGMHWTWAEPKIEDCNLVGNSALHGGGILCVGGISEIVRSDFSENTATGAVGQGGAICLLGANGLIMDCNISNNDANGSGGGIYISSKDLNGTVLDSGESILLKNCLITDNQADRDGGGVSTNWYSEPDIINCTIADNIVTGESFTTSYGGGLYCSYGSYAKILNSILWGNLAIDGPQIAIATSQEYDPRPSTVDVSYSDVEGAQSAAYVEPNCVLNWGIGNLYENPRFVTGPLGDYYLEQIVAGDPNQTVVSPCVDTGSDFSGSYGMHNYTTRTDAVPDQGIIDMGYHYQFDIMREPCGYCDLISDGVVDMFDLGVFVSNWLSEGCSESDDWCNGADFNFDTSVNFFDYSFFMSCWLNEDMTAPIPNPAEWEVEPYSSSDTAPWSISMKAEEAHDAWGMDVQYYFECVYGDCNDSGWQDDPNYTDTNLDPNTEYGYRVRAKDNKCGDGTDPNCSFDINDPNDPNIPNKTDWSEIRYAIAGQEIPGPGDFNAPVPDPMTWAVVPEAVDSNSITMTATTAIDPEDNGVEYYFECTATGGHDSDWQDSTTYVDTGLDPNTEYCYKVWARDKSLNQNETGWSIPDECATTLEEGEEPNEPNEPPPLVAPEMLSTRQYFDDVNDYWHHEIVASVSSSDAVYYRFVCTDEGGFSSEWVLREGTGVIEYDDPATPLIAVDATVTYEGDTITYDRIVRKGGVGLYRYWQVCGSDSAGGGPQECSDAVMIGWPDL